VNPEEFATIIKIAVVWNSSNATEDPASGANCEGTRILGRCIGTSAAALCGTVRTSRTSHDDCDAARSNGDLL
jgi:hypothetical protein